MTQHPIVFGMRAVWPGQLGRVEMHQQRTGGDLSHINGSRTHLNQFLVGDENWREEVIEDLRRASELNLRHSYHARRWHRKRKKESAEIKRLGPQNPWKSDRSEGPIREGILTAKKQYFDGDMPGFQCPEKIREFRRQAMKFLTENFGPSLRAAWEDLDEEAYHIHFIIVPVVATKSKNRGKQRMLVPSSIPVIKSYEHGHDVAAEYFKDVGLVRGEKRAERRRQALAAEQESELPASNTPCHIWRAEEAVKLDKKRKKVMSETDKERAEMARRKREAESAEVRAIEAEERIRKADAARAARIKKEDRQRAEKAAELDAREKDITRKAGLLNRAIATFYPLLDKVKAVARKLGMRDPVLDQSEMDAVKRVKDIVGELGVERR